MNAKHTQGPWDFPLYSMSDEHIEEARKLGMEPVRFHHNDGSVNVMAGSGDDRKAIAHVLCQTPYKRGEGYKTVCAERDANARLLAAAPDMLAALKKWVAVEDARDELTFDEYVERSRDAEIAARDAISKAEDA